MPLFTPFAGIAHGSTVRSTTIDGKNYLSVRDLIMMICDKNNKRASETWIQTISEDQKLELASLLNQYQFPGDHRCACFVDVATWIMS